jgi:hypothetical protein
VRTLPEVPMAKISLRRLLSKLTVLALSAAPAVANADAPVVSQSAFDDADLDADVPIDREHIDPRDAATVLGRTLARALGEMRPLAATHLAATWALADDPVRRAAIANALEWAFPLVGDVIVIDHLSRDPDPMIRAATARAAWVRRASGADQGVLARLADDPDPEVRAIAGRAR